MQNTRLNIRLSNLNELKLVRYKGIHFENPNLVVNKQKATKLPMHELDTRLRELKRKIEFDEIGKIVNFQKFNEIKERLSQSPSPDLSRGSNGRPSERRTLNSSKRNPENIAMTTFEQTEKYFRQLLESNKNIKKKNSYSFMNKTMSNQRVDDSLGTQKDNSENRNISSTSSLFKHIFEKVQLKNYAKSP